MSISDKVVVIKDIVSLVTTMLPKLVEVVLEVVGLIKEAKNA